MARLYLTQREYDELYEKQGRRCCVEGCTESEGLVGEHSTPQVWLWAKPDQLMCPAHHKPKTRRDIQAIWKVKRLNGEVMSQYERRKKFGSQLRGRGFYRGGG
ncbi:MAG: hypothetical protein AB7T08_11780 [Hyphomonadaceae bacterium]